MIGPDALEAIRRAGDYCARLAAVEHAHILGDDDELDLLLSSVDPIDARLTANHLRAFYAIHSLAEDRGGSTDECSDAAEVTPLSVHSSSSSTAAGSDGVEQPTAPNVYPLDLTHAGDNWSRKVPCR